VRDHRYALHFHVSSYSQLKVGNYWIYQEYDLDSTGTIATPTNVYDSCYIKRDTIIRGNVYHEYSFFPFPNQIDNELLRDSADCIVNNYGEIEFSLSNFSTALSSSVRLDLPPSLDTIYTTSIWMTDKNFSTTVPAGTFSTINTQMRFHMYPPYDFNGTYRNRNRRYAKNVGPVAITKYFYIAFSTYKELRLVRYHVN